MVSFEPEGNETGIADDKGGEARQDSEIPRKITPT